MISVGWGWGLLGRRESRVCASGGGWLAGWLVRWLDEWIGVDMDGWECGLQDARSMCSVDVGGGGWWQCGGGVAVCGSVWMVGMVGWCVLYIRVQLCCVKLNQKLTGGDVLPPVCCTCVLSLCAVPVCCDRCGAL